MIRARLQSAALAPALGVGVFLTAAYCFYFPAGAGGVPTLWLTNGLPLAALLRTNERRWPLLMAAALTGNIVAALVVRDAPVLIAAFIAATNLFQYWLCALIVRRRFGCYFDLTEIRQMAWLFGLGAATTLVKAIATMLFDNAVLNAVLPTPSAFAVWSLMVFLGLYALSLPVLAITSRSALKLARFDRTGQVILAVLAVMIVLIFGPPGLPGMYIVMPLLMLLAWRHGLLGAGLGALILIVGVALLLLAGEGPVPTLLATGYGPSARGIYIELYFGIAIMMSLPLGAARARQQAVEDALADALATAERRAAELAESEAAARRSELALLENENRWRAALEGSGLGVWDWDIESGDVYYSETWKSMLGYDADEIGTNIDEWRDRLHPDDREPIAAALDAYLRGEGSFFRWELRLRCKDGSYKWVLDRGAVFERGADGRPVRLIGTHADIDQPMQAAIRMARHGRLYVALTACNAAVARRDDMKVMAANICRILVESGDISTAWIGIANSATGLIEPVSACGAGIEHLAEAAFPLDDDNPESLSPAVMALRRERPIWIDDLQPVPDAGIGQGAHGAASLPIPRKDGPAAILTLYTARRDYFDDDTRTLLADMASQFSLALDTIDAELSARRSQDSLAESERRFRMMFEAAPMGIALMDSRNGDFLTVNPKFAAIVGWSARELMAKRWQDITHADDLDTDLAMAKQFLRGAIPGYVLEKRYVRKDGKPVWVHMTIARFALAGEPQLRHLCMVEDVTEQKELQNQVLFAQRMEAIGQLTGGVAHDFNNLLTIVIGSSEALIEQSDDPDRRQLAELILQAAEQGGELTRQLLAFSRRQPLAPRAFDVNTLLDHNFALIQRTLRADLHFSIRQSAGLAPVYADPAQTEAAILNLCLNARDAMPADGTLTIATELATLSEDYCRRHPDARPGDYVAIRVSDTGTGIAPEILDRVFEPFFTTKEPGRGTGLGLSMVYGFIRQSDGHLHVASELGKGSSFTLYLPVAAEPVLEDSAQLAERRAFQGGSENVLVVEDNELVRDHAGSQFIALGYKVVTAANGSEALAILEKRDDIDLLFTDVVMPGMNGRELAERAVARWPRLRILYTSGYSKDALTREGRLLAGVTLLSKPYSKRDLAEKVRRVLDEVP